MASMYNTGGGNPFDFDIGEETRRAQERARRDPRHPSNVKVKPPPPPPSRPPFDIPDDFPLPPDDFPRPRPDQDPDIRKLPPEVSKLPPEPGTKDLPGEILNFEDFKGDEVLTFGPGQGGNPYTGATSQGTNSLTGATNQRTNSLMDRYRGIEALTPAQEAERAAYVAQNPGDYRRAASAIGVRNVPYPTDADGNELGAPPNSRWDSARGRWVSKPEGGWLTPRGDGDKVAEKLDEDRARAAEPKDEARYRSDGSYENPFGSEEGDQAPTDAGVHEMIERDKGAWLDNLRTHAWGFRNSGEGSNWEAVAQDELNGALRQMRYAANAGTDPKRWLDEAKARITRRIQADNSGDDAGNVNGGRQIGRLSPIQASGGGPTLDAGLAQMLQQRGESSESQQQSIRDILMEQLGQATGPIDMSSDAMRTQLDPQRVALQRSAERQRSQMAARLAQEGLLDSGTFDTGLSGIEQQRGESEASMTGQVVGRELESRRTQVMNLLNMALRSGDAESARVLSGQLQMLDMQLRKELTLSGQQITRDQNLAGNRLQSQALQFNRDQNMAGNNLQLQALMNQLAISQLPYERVNLGTRQY